VRGWWSFLLLAVVLSVASAWPARGEVVGGVFEASAPCTCDEVIGCACRATSWTPTGDTTCGFSLLCGFPWFQAYYVEKTRVVTCTYTCFNGCIYTRRYPQRGWFRNRCCSGVR